jgi:hypothetical protein
VSLSSSECEFAKTSGDNCHHRKATSSI